MGKDSIVQVTKDHYDFDKYVGLDRWNSYYYQISEVVKCKGKSVLLIGAWDGIVVDVLKRLNKHVTTFDFDQSLKPDIVWDVTMIDEIITKKYDVIVCCQVLEHIPFDMFDPTIKKIQNIFNEKFILSLPNRNIRIKFFAPIIRHVKFPIHRFWNNQWNINKEWNGEHYREIDATKEYKLINIKKIINQYYDIKEIYTPFNNTYHTFRILWNRTGNSLKDYL